MRLPAIQRKTATTMRYTHPAGKRKLETVQRLISRATGTLTGTTPAEEGGAERAPAEVIELPREESAPGGIRTPNPQIRSRSGATTQQHPSCTKTRKDGR